MTPFTSEEKFIYKSIFGGVYDNCHFVISQYCSPKNIYIGIVSDDEGPIGPCTINIEGVIIPENQVLVKNYSENEGMDKFLLENDIITGEPVDYISSGFVDIPVYKLGTKGKELVSKYFATLKENDD